MQYLLRALKKYNQRFLVFQKMNDLQTADLDGDSCNEKKVISGLKNLGYRFQ